MTLLNKAALCHQIEIIKILLNQKGIASLFSARHAKTNKLFYVFYQSEELGQALTEFTEKKAEFFKNN